MTHHACVVTKQDIHVYLTLAGSYRAYLRSEAKQRLGISDEASMRLNVWAINDRKVWGLLAQILAELDIPFDFSE